MAGKGKKSWSPVILGEPAFSLLLFSITALLIGTDTVQRCDQYVYILAGVVGRKDRAHRRFNAETAQDGLGTVMPGAHGNTLFVECDANIVRALVVEHQRDDPSLFPGCADNLQARHRAQAGSGVFEKVVFIPTDVFQPDGSDIIQGGAQTNRVSNVSGAG